METIVLTIVISSVIGGLSALILFMVSRQFHVEEDPRIAEVQHALPGANCSACGYIGCRNFAEECVKTEQFEKLYCTVGGNTTMAEVAKILGKVAIQKTASIAVVRCNGTFQNRPKRSEYDGPEYCGVAHLLSRGETGCQYGCLWLGDCVKACKYDAIALDPVTGLPVVNEDKCISCGAFRHQGDCSRGD